MSYFANTQPKLNMDAKKYHVTSILHGKVINMIDAKTKRNNLTRIEMKQEQYNCFNKKWI